MTNCMIISGSMINRKQLDQSTGILKLKLLKSECIACLKVKKMPGKVSLIMKKYLTVIVHQKKSEVQSMSR